VTGAFVVGGVFARASSAARLLPPAFTYRATRSESRSLKVGRLVRSLAGLSLKSSCFYLFLINSRRNNVASGTRFLARAVLLDSLNVSIATRINASKSETVGKADCGRTD